MTGSSLCLLKGGCLTTGEPDCTPAWDELTQQQFSLRFTPTFEQGLRIHEPLLDTRAPPTIQRRAP
ncbi:hypothetical protein A2U01_0097874, partial [Trifolium medium]|nr:hypothetical protein [Trifolium medium]